MITDDEVVRLFASANPVPHLDAVDAPDSVGATTPMSEGRSDMSMIKTRETEETTTERPKVVAALAAGVALAILFLFPGGDEQEVAAPPPNPEVLALQTSEDFMSALTRGDAVSALAMLTEEAQQTPGNREAVEFFAALPGTKTLSDCTVSPGPIGFSVQCATHYNGPLMQAIGENSTGSFNVSEGRLTTMFVPGDRQATAEAFVEYASQVEPEAFDRACDLASYDLGSVRTMGAGFAFAGPCGELWAQVSDDAAAWVEAGRPPLDDDGS